jgi:hypothetical protein
MPAHHPGGAVPPDELESLRATVSNQPHPAEHAEDVALVQFPVLTRGRVDGRWDHSDSFGRQPFRYVPFPGEDECIGEPKVTAQEVPALLGREIGLVTADVATPHDVRTELAHTVNEPCGLRIMQQDDIASAHNRLQAGQVVLQDPRVMLMLGGTEIGSGSRDAMQRVVNPLGDREERRVGVEHHPPGVDAGAARIREQRLQHLCDTPAVWGGVDVPHDSVGQQRARPLGGPPGIKEGRLQITNTSAEPIAVALQASASSGKGCWYAPSWADAPHFPAGSAPTGGITLAAGQTSAVYTMGAYTAGPSGACAVDPDNNPNDSTGTWRGYLVITPTNHPADTRLVDLRLNRDLSVDVDDQAGGLVAGDPTETQGSTVVKIAYTGNHLAAFGLWDVRVSTPVLPTPGPSPAVKASRLSPEDFSGAAVYRFDVTGATYQLPSPYPNQIVVPPLIVQGSVDGNSWTNLGTLIPRTEPTIEPIIVNGKNAAKLTLGPATFWWENPAGQPVYEYIQVGLGPTEMTAVTLSKLSIPSDPNVGGPQINATNQAKTAAPVDSGLDEAPLMVEVLDNNNNELPFTDPSYQRIYYRDGFNHLITNLFDATNPDNFIGVSPYAGAYPNNGTETSGQPGTFDGFHYVATTSTNLQQITGYIAGAISPSQPINVNAMTIETLKNNPNISATGGISLTCVDEETGASIPCPLAPILQGGTAACSLNNAAAFCPAYYVNGGQLGMLTTAVATTSVDSLPLQQTAGTADHLLGSAPLTVTTAAATLNLTGISSNLLSSDQVDTTLVTHGMLASPPIINVPVGS